jgi:hypothetical protein
MSAQKKSIVDQVLHEGATIHQLLFGSAPEGIIDAALVEFRPSRDGDRSGELHLIMSDQTWTGEWSLPSGAEDFRLTALWEDLEQAKRLYEIGVDVINKYLVGRGKPN